MSPEFHVNEAHLRSAALKAVKDNVRFEGWSVYENYEIEHKDGEVFVTAPITFSSFFERDTNDGPQPNGASGPYAVYEGRSPDEDSMSVYAPLETPEIVLELAELAENEITPEAVLNWAQVYGLLGFPDEDTVRVDEGFLKFNVNGRGRRDRVRSFSEAAQEIRSCLRIYEAITSDAELNLEEIQSYLSTIPRKARTVSGPERYTAGQGRSRLFAVIGKLINIRLQQYCFPGFSTHVKKGIATGEFSLAIRFKSLIGAMWLQMASLLETEGHQVKRCKLPGCLKVISFSPGIPHSDPGLKRNARGKYRTRSDKEFCTGRGCKQKYHYRRKAGWPGYS